MSIGIRRRLQHFSLIATICEPPSRTHSTIAVSLTLHHSVRIWFLSFAATTVSGASASSIAKPSTSPSEVSEAPSEPSELLAGSSSSGTDSQKTVPDFVD